jgi:hypothetical protein
LHTGSSKQSATSRSVSSARTARLISCEYRAPAPTAASPAAAAAAAAAARGEEEEEETADVGAVKEEEEKLSPLLVESSW